MKNEPLTTAIFAAVAVVSLALAWFVRPQAIRTESEISNDLKGNALFKDLDPNAAHSFRVVKFNEDMATLSQLELAKDPNTEVWTLPSSDSYPADSAEQVSQAMAPLADLRVLSTVPCDRGDHSLYGVVEPKEDLTVSSTGVGTLVRATGAKGEELAGLIIGKAVEGTTDQRYVRVPSQDAVYIVQLKTDAYTTQFEKWIKGEILTVRSMDISNVTLRDYAIVPIEGGFGLSKNFDADLAYKDNKWSMNKFVDHKVEGSPETNEVPEGKALGESVLNELRNSIQNLKIVGVRRKPAGLAQDLKAEESLLKNKESTASLQKQGFFPMENKEVYSAGGELLVGTKDGINYLLRFGNSSISANVDENKDKDKKEEDTSARRYLLVMAQLDESKFPAPELKVVPETVEQMLQMEAAEKAKAEAKNPALSIPAAQPTPTAPAVEGDSAKPANETAPAEATKTETPVNETPKSEPTATSEQPAPKSDSPAGTEPAPQPATEPAAPQPSPTEPPAAEPPKSVNSGRPNSVYFVSTAQEAKQEPDKAEAPASAPGANPGAPGANPAAPATQVGQPDDKKTTLEPSRKETQEELQERLQFLQESIKKENKRLLDARNDALKAATKKVKELNIGFADWYYQVSDSVYTKLRLSRDQLFTAPTPANNPAPGIGGQAFPPNFNLPTGN